MLKRLLLSLLLLSPYCIAQQGGGPGGGGGGATTPATSNVLKGTGSTNGVAAATPGTDYLAPGALPSSTTATTAAPGDNTTKVATTAFVIANAGGAAAIPATTNVLKGNNVLGSAAIATPGTDYLIPGALPATTTSTTLPSGDKTTKLANTTSVWNSMPGLMAQYFGAYGDAFSPANGLSTTASSTTVGCPDACFLSTDVGKQVWVPGAGAAGVAFNATITAFQNSGAVTVSAAATATLSNVSRSVYGHDDVTAINSCIQYSSVNAVQCWLRPFAAPSGQNGVVGFLIGSGTLLLTENNAYEENSGPHLVGNSQSNGTNLFCEFNGDCMALAAGPIQGATVADVSFEEDPTQPNSRGIHLNPQPGAFTNGPFTNSNFLNVNVDNPAKECLWLDGGGGPGYAYNLPNQYVTFNQFWCSGPNQSHPANLMLMTGQAAQIIFINGQVNGAFWNGSSTPNYPNPMVLITEKTSGLGDTPVDVKFYGYTIEVGTQGLYIGNGASNIHYDNGYIENVSTPYSVTGAVENTFNGNHIANSGNITGVVQFAAGSGGSVRDNLIYGAVAPPAAFAVCSGTNQIDFANNNLGSGVTTSTGCATVTASTGSSSLTVTSGTTASVTASGGAIDTITANAVAPGKTLTLYAPGGMQLASGGNIALGGATSPVTIPSGGTVVLTLLDSGVTWLVTSGASSGGGSATPNWSAILAGTNTATGNFSTNGNWFFHQSGYFDSNSGTQFFSFGPNATPGSDCTNVFDDGNFHIDATACGNHHGLFFKGQFSTQYIVGFQNASSGTNQFEVGLDGTLITLGGVQYPTYTVATLPGVPGAGKAVVVTDALGFTAGSCTGGGSSTVLAISNGTNWVCQTPSVLPICSGQITLGTTLITSGNAATTIAQSCTGIQSTDNIQLDYASSPIGVTGYTNSASGMLSIIKWPSTNLINVSIFNNTGASITPGAMTLNYHVTR